MENPSQRVLIGPAERIALLLGSVALALTIFSRLSQFPGLHGDEAWFGLAAHDLEHGRLRGMNWYTGNIFPLVVAGLFALFGEGILQLRLLGAIANSAAVLTLALTLASVFGFPAAWVYLCLTGTSLYWLWQSRIAWEVTAFTLPLIALVLVSILPFWSKRNPNAAARPLTADFAVLVLCWIGVLSHVIFALAVSAFAGAALIAMVRNPSRTRVELAVLLVYAVILMPAIVVRELAGALRPLPPIWLISLLLAVTPPLLMGLLYVCTRRRVGWIAERFSTAASAWLETADTSRPVRWAAITLLAASLAPFLFLHGESFVMAVSGLGSAQRMASIVPSEPIRIVILVSGAGFVGVLAAVMALARRRLGKGDSPLRFLTVAAFLSWALLPVIVRGTSLRYYAVPYALLLLGAAAAAGTLIQGRSRGLLAAITIAPVAVGVFALTEQARPYPRPPIRFRLGPMNESSAHFLPIEPLVAALRAHRSCRVSAQESAFFIEMPVQFMYRTAPWDCVPDVVCRVEYCLSGVRDRTPGSGHFHVVCADSESQSRHLAPSALKHTKSAF
jgi:hypothetical protein